MDGAFFVFSLAGALICGLAGSAMLGSVDRGGTGFLLGFLLGPIGLVIAWVKRDDLQREAADRARRHRPIDEGAPGRRQSIAAQPVRKVATLAGSGGPSAIEELERLAA